MTKEELYRELVKQKMEMTPGERMKAYMAGEEVDCIPHRLLSADDALGVAWGYSKHDLYNNLDVRAAQLRKKQELYGDIDSVQIGTSWNGNRPWLRGNCIRSRRK